MPEFEQPFSFDYVDLKGYALPGGQSRTITITQDEDEFTVTVVGPGDPDVSEIADLLMAATEAMCELAGDLEEESDG